MSGFHIPTVVRSVVRGTVIVLTWIVIGGDSTSLVGQQSVGTDCQVTSTKKLFVSSRPISNPSEIVQQLPRRHAWRRSWGSGSGSPHQRQQHDLKQGHFGHGPLLERSKQAVVNALQRLRFC